jgi:hypothetical protein
VICGWGALGYKRCVCVAGYDGGVYLHIAGRIPSLPCITSREFSVRNIICMARQSVRLKGLLKVLLYSTNIILGLKHGHLHLRYRERITKLPGNVKPLL